tara:strand:- start:547 stop:789 length:243 start_codon:yes stop_codon:yes gene_type:complete
MKRVIECFLKETEELVKTYELPSSITLESLQKLVLEENDDDYNLVFCYSLSEEHITFFQEHTHIEFNSTKYDYTLSYTEK